MIKAIHIYFQNKIFKPLIGYLKQGLSPEKMALTFACSVVIGMIPAWGVVTGACFVVAMVARLNLPAMIVITTAITPLQIFGYIPFIQLGTGVFGGEANFSFGEMAHLIQTDFREALRQMGYANLKGVFAWLVLALPAGWVLYYTSLSVFQKLALTAVEDRLELD